MTTLERTIREIFSMYYTDVMKLGKKKTTDIIRVEGFEYLHALISQSMDDVNGYQLNYAKIHDSFYIRRHMNQLINHEDSFRISYGKGYKVILNVYYNSSELFRVDKEAYDYDVFKDTSDNDFVDLSVM